MSNKFAVSIVSGNSVNVNESIAPNKVVESAEGVRVDVFIYVSLHSCLQVMTKSSITLDADSSEAAHTAVIVTVVVAPPSKL